MAKRAYVLSRTYAILWHNGTDDRLYVFVHTTYDYVQAHARRRAFLPNLAKTQRLRGSTSQAQQAGRHSGTPGTGLAIRAGMSATADRQPKGAQTMTLAQAQKRLSAVSNMLPVISGDLRIGDDCAQAEIETAIAYLDTVLRAVKADEIDYNE